MLAIQSLFFPNETGVYELFDFRFDYFHNLLTESSLLLLNWFRVQIDVEAMHGHLWVESRHVLIVPSEDVYILLPFFSEGDKLSLIKMGLG